MDKKFTKQQEQQDPTVLTTTSGGAASADIEHMDIPEDLEIDDADEFIDEVDEPVDDSGIITHRKIRKFINSVIDRHQSTDEQLALIYGVGRSSVANWRHLGIRSRKGFPQVDKLNNIAMAHGLEVWALVRCIQLEEEAPPIQNFQRVYKMTIATLSSRNVESLDADFVLRAAKTLEKLAKKMVLSASLGLENHE